MSAYNEGVRVFLPRGSLQKEILKWCLPHRKCAICPSPNGAGMCSADYGYDVPQVVTLHAGIEWTVDTTSNGENIVAPANAAEATSDYFETGQVDTSLMFGSFFRMNWGTRSDCGDKQFIEFDIGRGAPLSFPARSFELYATHPTASAQFEDPPRDIVVVASAGVGTKPVPGPNANLRRTLVYNRVAGAATSPLMRIPPWSVAAMVLVTGAVVAQSFNQHATSAAAAFATTPAPMDRDSTSIPIANGARFFSITGIAEGQSCIVIFNLAI